MAREKFRIDGQRMPKRIMVKGKKNCYHTTGIPKPRRTVEERIELGKKICALYSLGKYTLPVCCSHYHVSIGAFLSWACPSVDVGKLLLEKKPLPPKFLQEIHDLYKEASKLANENYGETLKGRAREGLMKKVGGYEVEEVNEEYVLDKELYIQNPETGEKEPNPDFGKMVLVRKKVKKYHQAPDTAAITFALTNVDKDNFKDRKFVNNESTVYKDNNVEGIKSLEDAKQKRRELELELERKRMQKQAEDVEYELIEKSKDSI